MTTDNTFFNPDFLTEITQLTAQTLNELQVDGTLVYAFHTVELIFEKSIDGDDTIGRPGKKIQKRIGVNPRPRVDMRSQFVKEDDIVQKIGDCLVSQIPTTYAREQLQGATHWLIDGAEYTLVNGTLRRMPNGVFWEATLIRRKQNSLVAP